MRPVFREARLAFVAVNPKDREIVEEKGPEGETDSCSNKIPIGTDADQLPCLQDFLVFLGFDERPANPGWLRLKVSVP